MDKELIFMSATELAAAMIRAKVANTRNLNEAERCVAFAVRLWDEIEKQTAQKG